MRAGSLIPLLLVTIGLIGCQAPRPFPGDPEQPYPPQPPAQAGDILHLPTGYHVTQQTVVDHSQRVQVVFVGETHDNPASHRVQEHILHALHQNNPGKVALAMEMFAPSQQPLLDRWSAGEMTEKEFLKQIDWYATWGIDFALYRDLLFYCRDHGIKLVALNAERDSRQKLSRLSIEELSPEDRELLPEMDFNDPYHQAMLAAFHAGHTMGPGMLDGFERVQTLWDEAMAANLADYLGSRDSTHQVVVIAGSNHIRYGFGIPRRTFRRLPVSYLLIGTTETEDSGSIDPTRLMSVTQPDYPLLPYHFLYYTSYEKLPRTGVRLGVVVTAHEDPQGLLIETLLPDSAALAQGLHAQDLLLELDGEPLVETFDLIYPLQQKKIGETARLSVLRGDELLTFDIEFTEDNQQQHGRR